MRVSIQDVLRLLCCLAASTTMLALTTDARAQAKPEEEEEEIIIIEEDEPPPEPTGPPMPPLPPLPPTPSVLEGRTPPLPPTPPRPPSPTVFTLSGGPADPTAGQTLGERSLLGLKASHFALTGRFGSRASARPGGRVENDLLRTLSEAAVTIQVRPDLPFHLYGEVYTRARAAAGIQVPRRLTPDFTTPLWRRKSPWSFDNRVSGVVELGEVHATLKVKKARLRVGRQLFSWSAALSSPVSSMLNPPDPRDGLAFPDELQARTPVLSTSFYGALGPVGVELVVIPLFVPPRAPLFAEDAEAWDLAEPVGSLLVSRAGMDAHAADALQRGVPLHDRPVLGDFSPTVGARAFLALERADVSLAAVFGHDPVPELQMSDDTARALGAASDRQAQHVVNAPLADACGDERCSALEGSVAYRFRRAMVAQAEVSGTVGPAVVRGMAHLSPLVGPQIGRTVHVVARDGTLRSADVWTAGVVVGVESGYTELVQGALEAGYDLINGVPDGARIARLEPTDQARAGEHTVHRPTLQARLRGSFFDTFGWRFATLLAPWQRDAGMSARVTYQLAVNAELATGLELFAGWPGSKGWYLTPMSRGYLEWSYRF
ncbi:MAG: hypothetical protein AB2A00_00260 [Myxococcota bacterium]